MEHDKFMQYGRGLGLWRNPRENINPDPINYFSDDPIYLTPSKGEWINQIQECKKENNPLENGVFIWTEIKGTGHAFVSIHEGNSASVFTYGRFGRRSGAGGTVGDGILNFLRFEDARTYYREELYKMEAKAFIITDADPTIARMYFERLWHSGSKAKETPDMGDDTKRDGHTVDQYDVTGVNCTTHTTKGVKIAGSQIFEGGYTTQSQMRIDYEEDFAVPVSLQRYLERKSAESSMLVVDMTSEFRKQYPNINGFNPLDESTIRMKAFRAAAEIASGVGKVSPYSGGTVGGLLEGMHDVNK
ncbi:hypothetical protein H4F47_18735 [Pectobacterium brasiliense]|uniref:hypothetical protein n=1 Tax=Pectobacterium TaxID=122277 RepID=UPI0019690067|nr:hypothetical protein [Pectobacterium brasiliense]